MTNVLPFRRRPKPDRETIACPHCRKTILRVEWLGLHAHIEPAPQPTTEPPDGFEHFLHKEWHPVKAPWNSHRGYPIHHVHRCTTPQEGA